MHVSNYSINFTKGLFSSGFATITQMFLDVSLLKSQVILSDGVMINFMCLLVSARGCPDSWLIMISGCVYEGVSRTNEHLNL